MSPELISILVLAVIFVIATVLPINIGVLAFAGAFLVGTLVADQSTDDIIGGFPSDLFLTLVGITFLFAIAQNNGTIDWLVELAVRGVRGRIGAIPWIMFLIAAVLTAVGAVSPGAVAIIAPIALGFAVQYKISPLLMGLMVIHGAQAGGFSPISIYGGITNGVVERAGLPLNEVATFLASLIVNFAVAVALFAQHAWLSPLPPEGASAVLYRTTDRAVEMAERQGVGSAALRSRRIVDRVIPEHPDAADEGEVFLRRVGAMLQDELGALLRWEPSARMAERRRRYRTLGQE
jgi:Na+/H+ antiporter NhaD/arsenite permease-like protein